MPNVNASKIAEQVARTLASNDLTHSLNLTVEAQDNVIYLAGSASLPMKQIARNLACQAVYRHKHPVHIDASDISLV